MLQMIDFYKNASEAATTTTIAATIAPTKKTRLHKLAVNLWELRELNDKTCCHSFLFH